MKVAIIPARGGSKRIPSKNIKEFHGKPIISYSIETAIKSNCFDRIIVSTDDDEIAHVAMKYGAEVPFVRPQEISGDYATTLDVIQHGIEWLESNDHCSIDYVCCIYATAPFMISEDIISGLNLISEPNVDFAFSATTYAFPIQRSIFISDKNVEMFFPEHFHTRSQDLKEAYHDAGQFYWGTVDSFKSGSPVFGEKSKIVLIPRKRVQDIDTPEDWDYAELVYGLL